MGAARTGRSPIVVGGREFLYSFDNDTGHRHIVSADKRFVVRTDFGGSAGGVPATVTVIGRECPAVADPTRPLRVSLPRFEHAYSLKGHARRLIEWCLTPLNVP